MRPRYGTSVVPSSLAGHRKDTAVTDTYLWIPGKDPAQADKDPAVYG